MIRYKQVLRLISDEAGLFIMLVTRFQPTESNSPENKGNPFYKGFDLRGDAVR